MAFDKEDAADLLALKTEVNTDPIAMGYVPANTDKVIKDLNIKSRNVGLETANEMFTSRLARNETKPVDLDVAGMTDGKQLYVIHAVLNHPNLDENLDAYRSKYINQLPALSDSVTDIEARTERITRAEVLFGRYTDITREDWLAARDS